MTITRAAAESRGQGPLGIAVDKNDTRLNSLLPGDSLSSIISYTEYNYGRRIARLSFGSRTSSGYIPPLFFIRFACEPITDRLLSTAFLAVQQQRTGR
jgi:hypothetical protein